jgi:hypothetical protein
MSPGKLKSPGLKSPRVNRVGNQVLPNFLASGSSGAGYPGEIFSLRMLSACFLLK